MTQNNSGYSKTPLHKKLGLKEGFNVLFHNLPKEYFKFYQTIPESLTVLERIEIETADFIHLFFTSMEKLKRSLPKFKLAMKKNGCIWISWPKGGSKIQTDLNGNLIRSFVLDSGLVDIKVAAINQDWSGLKFVYRLKDR